MTLIQGGLSNESGVCGMYLSFDVGISFIHVVS